MNWNTLPRPPESELSDDEQGAESDDEDDAYGSDDTVMQDQHDEQPTKKKRVTSFLIPITNGEESFSEQRRDKRRSSFKAPATSDDPATAGGHPPKTPHRRLSQLNAVPMTPALPASIEIMSSNYEEWMKMATDNVSFSGRSQPLVKFLLFESTRVVEEPSFVSSS